METTAAVYVNEDIHFVHLVDLSSPRLIINDNNNNNNNNNKYIYIYTPTHMSQERLGTIVSP